MTCVLVTALCPETSVTAVTLLVDVKARSKLNIVQSIAKYNILTFKLSVDMAVAHRRVA